MRFTDRGIAALRPRPERYEVWEDGRTGFGLRVAPSGRKSWVWLYRHRGRPRRISFGTYPELGLADAHLRLAEARKILERGDDPGLLLAAGREAERAAETVEELAELYLEKWARPRKRSARECPSSNALRRLGGLASGGSGPSGLQVMRLGSGAASAVAGWFCA